MLNTKRESEYMRIYKTWRRIGTSHEQAHEYAKNRITRSDVEKSQGEH